MAKKNIFKKTLAIALAAMLTLGAGPLMSLCEIEFLSPSSLNASAATEEPLWTDITDIIVVEGNTITGIAEGASVSGNIEIPSETKEGIKITAVGANAFNGYSLITAVKIPETLLSIEQRAFANCNIKNLYFNANNCSVSIDAVGFTKTHPFEGNNLTTIVFGTEVNEIPSNVCYNITSLQYVLFDYSSNAKITIGDQAFYNCTSLEAIDLSNVKSIGAAAFYNCTFLNVIDDSISNAEADGKIVFSDNIETIGACAFQSCTSLKEVTIPEGVKTIGYKAFADCEITKVYFNASSCEVQNDTDWWRETTPFVNNSKLTAFEFGEKVKEIPVNACCNITSLQTVVFNADEVTSIGDYAFYNCTSLEAIDLSTVEKIGVEAFYNCTSLKITDKDVADDNADGKIVFSDNLKTIGACAFQKCTSFKEVTIPEGVKTIEYKAFADCKIGKVYFNASACDVKNDTNWWRETTPFVNNSELYYFVFGEKVTDIPVNACCNVTNLTEIVFNADIINSIGDYAFYNCTSLDNIHLAAYAKETFDFDSLAIGTGNDAITEDIFTFGIYSDKRRDEEHDVTVSFTSNIFDEEVNIKDIELSVTPTIGERENGSTNLFDNELRTTIGCFDIKLLLNGEPITFDGTVTVKMPIPEDYLDRKDFKIVHIHADGKKENFATNSTNSKTKITVEDNYLVFNVSSFSKFELMTFEAAPTVSIKNNSGSKTINYGDTLRLTASTSNMPADAKIFWYVDGDKAGEGTTFEVSPESGSVEVTVKVVDSDGNDYAGADISDSQEVSVKSGFFQKLISFFKNLFGISRIVTQAFMVK